jgi:hypothetical protein
MICHICNTQSDKVILDHRYKGGVLCWRCRAGIEAFDRDLDRLILAVSYVERHSRLQ